MEHDVYFFKQFVFIYILCSCNSLHVPVESQVSNSYYSDEISDENIVNGGMTLPANGEIFEGDIYMDDRLRKGISRENSKRSSVANVRKWKDGIIPYVADLTFTQQNMKLLNEAIKEYKMRTCIRFKERTNEKDYVIFTAKGDGCASYVGRKGGPQHVNLEKHCGIVGTYEHEIMHVLGFIHEHSRPDRDNYIAINFKNINKKAINNFYKYNFVNNHNEEFNYASIMLYRNNAFTKNGKTTINAVGDQDLIFGQRHRFSIGDIKQINRLYNCEYHLKNPFYAGLFGEYHGNVAREKIVSDRQKQDALVKSLKKVVYKSDDI